MSPRIRFAILLLVAAGRAPLHAQTVPEKVNALMEKYLAYGQFNGSVLVAGREGILFKRGYGFANFEWDVPNAPDTKFRLGSVTKQFTSMLVMQQVEIGTIRLDAPISRYLPDYPKPQGDRVTVRHLLTHTSGTPNYTSLPGFRDDRGIYPLEKLVARFSSLPLEFAPGTSWKYSNSGYVVLGAILEKATGIPYERLLQEKIFRPLGMKNSGYDHSEPILKKRAAGYENRGRLVNADFLDMSVPFSAGALYSTVEDLFLWDRALYGDSLLPERRMTEYFTPFLHNYAFGWGVGKIGVGKSKDSVMATWHGGGINGFNTLIVRVPEFRQLVVLLNNTGGTRLEEMSTAILGILHGVPYASARRSLADTLGSAIRGKGVAGMRAAYADLAARTTEYYMSEEEINQLGYNLLQEGKKREAIEVFTVNAEAFPRSWNVYDSLGEAYMVDEQTALAIKNYEKSIELNPGNAAGVGMLKKLKDGR